MLALQMGHHGRRSAAAPARAVIAWLHVLDLIWELCKTMFFGFIVLGIKIHGMKTYVKDFGLETHTGIYYVPRCLGYYYN